MNNNKKNALREHLLTFFFIILSLFCNIIAISQKLAATYWSNELKVVFIVNYTTLNLEINIKA